MSSKIDLMQTEKNEDSKNGPLLIGYYNNNVDHPSHYTQGDIECIDAIKASMSEEAFEGYLKGNEIKYLWRYRYKNNPVEDLRKAKWYHDKLLEVVENRIIKNG